MYEKSLVLLLRTEIRVDKESKKILVSQKETEDVTQGRLGKGHSERGCLLADGGSPVLPLQEDQSPSGSSPSASQSGSLTPSTTKFARAIVSLKQTTFQMSDRSKLLDAKCRTVQH